MKDEESQGVQVKKRIAASGKEAAAAAAAALTGLAVGGSTGAVVGAVATPIASFAMQELVARYSMRRQENAERVIELAIAEMGSNEEAFLAATEDPERELLAGKAVIAGGNTAYEAKIVTLGRILGRALIDADDAKLDEAAQLIGALSDIEAPHVLVLGLLAQNQYPGIPSHLSLAQRYRSLTRSELAAEFPRFGVALDGVTAALERHGLVERVSVDLERVFKAYGKRRPESSILPSEIRSGTTSWRITEFGLDACELLNQAARENGDGGES